MKKRWRNHFRLTETKETWQLHAIYDLEQNPFNERTQQGQLIKANGVSGLNSIMYWCLLIILMSTWRNYRVTSLFFIDTYHKIFEGRQSIILSTYLKWSGEGKPFQHHASNFSVGLWLFQKENWRGTSFRVKCIWVWVPDLLLCAVSMFHLGPQCAHLKMGMV